MPDKSKLSLVLANRVEDLRRVRLEGMDKPLDQLTISELVQLRPGSSVQDTYEVNAVTDNASVTTSSMLQELGRIQKVRVMQDALQQVRLQELSARLTPQLRQAARRSVNLPDPVEESSEGGVSGVPEYSDES
jgi:hypothetical protein